MHPEEYITHQEARTVAVSAGQALTLSAAAVDSHYSVFMLSSSAQPMVKWITFLPEM